MTLDRLIPQASAGLGVLLLLTGIYATGGVHATCRRVSGRVDCHMQTLRVFELVPVGSQDAQDVVDAYVFTSTSGTGPSSRSSGGHSSSNNTVVLETRDGEKVYAFGATKQGSHVSELRDFLRDPELHSLHVFSSNWIFGLAAMGFGGVWTLVMRFIIANSGDLK
jgi:hypothetical protein